LIRSTTRSAIRRPRIGDDTTVTAIPPRPSLSNSSVTENSPVETVVGVFSNVFDGALMTLSGGNGWFKVQTPSTRTLLTTDTPADFETNPLPSITITLEDPTGYYRTTSFVYPITVFNEVYEGAPVITTAAQHTFFAGEDYAVPLTADRPVTWALTGGANQASATVTGPTATLNPGTLAGTYVIQVTATGANTQSTPKTLTIVVAEMVQSAFQLEWLEAEGLDALKSGFGGFQNPYHQKSPWNAYPVNPTLSATGIRSLLYTSAGASTAHVAWLNKNGYGTFMSQAKEGDPSMTVYGLSGSANVNVGDEAKTRAVVIPRWPTNEDGTSPVTPATGSDGHAEIYDPILGVFHSFWKLRKPFSEANPTDKWVAAKYSCIPAGGLGWPYPERPDGPRAVGASTAGGALRIHDYTTAAAAAAGNGFGHALAIALAGRAIDHEPAYPAMLEDARGYLEYENRKAAYNHVNNANPGVRMGSHLLLPSDFSLTGLNTYETAMAKTLMRHGAYVTDMTGFDGNTFAFFGEIGSDWAPTTNSGSTTAVRQTFLTNVRNALKVRASQDSWVDGTGAAFTPVSWDDQNLLSMRLPQWVSGTNILSSPYTARFNTQDRLLVCPDTTTADSNLIVIKRPRPAHVEVTEPEPWWRWQQVKYESSDNRTRSWFSHNPIGAETYRFKVFGYGGFSARILIKTFGGATHYDSNTDFAATGGYMTPGQEITAAYVDGAEVHVLVKKSPGGASGIRVEMQRVAAIPEEPDDILEELFSNGERGAVFDPDRFESLYTSSAVIGDVGSQVWGIIDTKDWALSDDAASASIGANMIGALVDTPVTHVNGAMPNNSGWFNISNGSPAGAGVVGGVLVLTTTGTLDGQVYKTLTTVAGKMYRVSFRAEGVDFLWSVGTATSALSTQLMSTSGAIGSGFKEAFFVATGSVAYLHFGQSFTAGNTEIEDLQCQEMPGYMARAASRQTLTTHPVYRGYLDHDGVDDLLVAQFGTTLGATCTVASVTDAGGVTISTGVNIGTTYNLPTTDWRLCVIVDRALTGDETTALTAALEARRNKGSASYVWAGEQTTTSLMASVYLTQDGKVRLAVATTPSMDELVWSPAIQSVNKSARCTVTGLEPGTTYYGRFECDGTWVGPKLRMKTIKEVTTGVPQTFSVALGSCAGDTAAVSSSTSFQRVIDRNPDALFDMGDIHYQDIDSADPQLYRNAYETWVFRGPLRHKMMRNVNAYYMYDDHDSAGEDGFSDASTQQTGVPAVRRAYRDMVPVTPVEPGLTDPPYYTVKMGRMIFIVTDVRTAKSFKSNTDSASKTMMGAAQKAWFLNVLASNPGCVFTWVQTGVWISASGNDYWFTCSVERAEIANEMKRLGLQGKICMVSGDMHAQAIDSGANADYATGGGMDIPVFHAGPWNKPVSSKGGPYSSGTAYPASGTGQQYGMMTWTDNGVDPITVEWAGYKGSNNDSTGVSLTFQLTP
jgi:hypothetical protein